MESVAFLSIAVKALVNLVAAHLVHHKAYTCEQGG